MGTVGSSTAGIITAIASLFTAVALVISALAVFLPQMRKTRAELRAARLEVQAVREDVKEVHIMVNGQRTAMLQYQQTLTDALQAAGIPVPVDQSARDVGQAMPAPAPFIAPVTDEP